MTETTTVAAAADRAGAPTVVAHCPACGTPLPVGLGYVVSLGPVASGWRIAHRRPDGARCLCYVAPSWYSTEDGP